MLTASPAVFVLSNAPQIRPTTRETTPAHGSASVDATKFLHYVNRFIVWICIILSDFQGSRPNQAMVPLINDSPNEAKIHRTSDLEVRETLTQTISLNEDDDAPNKPDGTL